MMMGAAVAAGYAAAATTAGVGSDGSVVTRRLNVAAAGSPSSRAGTGAAAAEG